MADSSDDNSDTPDTWDMRDRLVSAIIEYGFDNPSTQFYREYIVRCLVADGHADQAMTVLSETRMGRLATLSQLAPGRYHLDACLATVGRVERDPASKVAHFQAVVAVSNGVLGPTARDSLEFRLRLAQALVEDGQVRRAVDVAECLLDDARQALARFDPLLGEIEDVLDVDR